MVESTQTSKNAAKNMSNIVSINKDQPAGEVGRKDRSNAAPGPEPVDKSTGGELDFEEDDIVESNLKGDVPSGEDPKFLELIRATPSQ
ncbi:hypothetical protein PtA15_8A585 [Puccinia triticina]|uniref:Uncharacterized protein n=1 Tax=Puccinia triticina TaxID=208348 RepID=A0ABY7CR41_9BASI|nr:uncharacterized protein PtA15_8A585 [Puccinia triticina]WAQ87679.1 hypothetical protein PtA15_8A585 [Puccinia triticina]WAR57540.1 hypothetical protein PtB15_8B592 [Puccinia triticina]